MKPSCLAVAVLAGVLVYLGGSLLYSRYGGAGTERLAAHVVRLQTNVDELQRIRAQLAAEVELLRSSPDAVALHARNLGYYRPGEQIIRIQGTTVRSTTRSPGTIVRRPQHAPDGTQGVRYAAIATSLLVLLGQMAVALHPMRRHSR